LGANRCLAGRGARRAGSVRGRGTGGETGSGMRVRILIGPVPGLIAPMPVPTSIPLPGLFPSSLLPASRAVATQSLLAPLPCAPLGRRVVLIPYRVADCASHPVCVCMRVCICVCMCLHLCLSDLRQGLATLSNAVKLCQTLSYCASVLLSCFARPLPLHTHARSLAHSLARTHTHTG